VVGRVDVIVAHPDDEILGVGGTILRHLEDGDDVHVHIECVVGLRDGEQRVNDALAAADQAGYVLTVGSSRQLDYRVPDLVIEADIVYTHHPGDLNRDHRMVAEAVQVACRPFTAEVRSLRYFETPSSTEWGAGFAPTLFVDIDANLGSKIDLYRHYETEQRQWPHPRSPRALIDRARYWGSVSGLRAAEAFVIGRERW
jgi:LmbE family N-acetylglucosaminyl deacetylase